MSTIDIPLSGLSGGHTHKLSWVARAWGDPGGPRLSHVSSKSWSAPSLASYSRGRLTGASSENSKDSGSAEACF